MKRLIYFFFFIILISQALAAIIETGVSFDDTNYQYTVNINFIADNINITAYELYIDNKSFCSWRLSNINILTTIRVCPSEAGIGGVGGIPSIVRINITEEIEKIKPVIKKYKIEFIIICIIIIIIILCFLFKKRKGVYIEKKEKIKKLLTPV